MMLINRCLCLMLLFVVCGCGISKEEHELLLNEYNSMEIRLRNVQSGLDAEQKAHAMTQGKLNAEQKARAAIQRDLDTEQKAHAVTHGKLNAEQDTHAVTQRDLDTEQKAHAVTHGKLNAEQDAHAVTRAKLNAEQRAHVMTQRDLDTEQDAHAVTQREAKKAYNNLATKYEALKEIKKPTIFTYFELGRVSVEFGIMKEDAGKTKEAVILYSQARDVLRKVITGNEGPEVHYYLAQSYYRLAKRGKADFKDACNHAKKAIALAPRRKHQGAEVLKGRIEGCK